MQRHAAAAVVIDVQPALLNDAAAALIQPVQRVGDAITGQHIALARFEHGGGLIAAVAQVGDGAKGGLAIVAGRRVQQHIAASQARFHFHHLLGFDPQFAGHGVDLLGR